MSFQEIMLFGQEYYRECILGITAVILLVHVVFSSCVMYYVRKVRLRVWASAYIPVVNIIILFSGIISKRSNRKKDLSEEIMIE